MAGKLTLPTPPGGFCVRVRPGGREDRVLSFEDGVLVVELVAPARDGKANVALVKFLSRELGRQVRIRSGLTRRDKVLVFV